MPTRQIFGATTKRTFYILIHEAEGRKKTGVQKKIIKVMELNTTQKEEIFILPFMNQCGRQK